MVLPDPIGGKAIVVPLHHTLRLRTTQHVDDMAHPKAFTSAQYTGEKFLRRHGQINQGGGRLDTVVTHATVVTRVGFAKVTE